MNPAVFILIVLAVAEAVTGLLGCTLARRAGERDTRNARIDAFRRGVYAATGTWPEHPPRRPGVIEP